MEGSARAISQTCAVTTITTLPGYQTSHTGPPAALSLQPHGAGLHVAHCGGDFTHVRDLGGPGSGANAQTCQAGALALCSSPNS